MKKKIILEGIFPALITPFTKSGEISEERLRELIDFLIEKGIHGIVPVGTTGEFMYMKKEEKRKVYEIVIDQVNGKIPVIAGAGASGTREAIELAEIAKDLGADAILVVSPFYLKPSDKGVYQHYYTLANKVDIPIILYNIPQCTGYYISGEVIEDLAEIDNIVALKDSSGNLAYMLEIMNRVNGKIKIFVGYDEVVMPALTSGANGAILASANVIPEIWVEIYEKIKRGEIKEAAKIQKSIQKLMRIITRKGGILAVKKALEMRGIKVGTARKPLNLGGSLTLENIEEIKLELEKLELVPKKEIKVEIKKTPLKESFIDLEISPQTIEIEKLKIGEGEEGEEINKVSIKVILGEKDSKVAQVYVKALAGLINGREALTAVLEPNLMIKPPTIIIPEIKIKSLRQASIIYGPIQAAISKAIIDFITKKEIEEQIIEKYVMIVKVSANPSLTDRREAFRNTYNAMMKALAMLEVIK